MLMDMVICWGVWFFFCCFVLVFVFVLSCLMSFCEHCHLPVVLSGSRNCLSPHDLCSSLRVRCRAWCCNKQLSCKNGGIKTEKPFKCVILYFYFKLSFAMFWVTKDKFTLKPLSSSYVLDIPYCSNLFGRSPKISKAVFSWPEIQ